MLKTLPLQEDEAQRHQELIYSVCFSPDGEILASASWDRTIKLWSRDGRLLKTLEGHEDWVTSVSFSPDSQRLVSGSKDKTVRIWSCDGVLLKTLEGHRNTVWGVCFRPDGKVVASASEDNTIKFWNCETADFEELLLRGCDWLHDYLKTNPNIIEEDRHLCDGIGTAN